MGLDAKSVGTFVSLATKILVLAGLIGGGFIWAMRTQFASASEVQQLKTDQALQSKDIQWMAEGMKALMHAHGIETGDPPHRQR